MFLNDWLVIKYQTTRMDLNEACEKHKEVIFNDAKIIELKKENSSYRSPRGS